MCFREQGGLAEAVESYARALERDPAYAEAYYNLGITLHLLRRFAEAIENYQRALALKPDYAAGPQQFGQRASGAGAAERGGPNPTNRRSGSTRRSSRRRAT